MTLWEKIAYLDWFEIEANLNLVSVGVTAGDQIEYLRKLLKKVVLEEIMKNPHLENNVPSFQKAGGWTML